MNYRSFLINFDKKLEKYFNEYNNYVFCHKGCSSCCEKGDYPVSQIELEYLMQGYSTLDDKIKQEVQSNFKNIKKGEKCPFLIDKLCSVYNFRPIVCRVHGLCYRGINTIILPYCTNTGKNFSSVYKNGHISIEPIEENFDTPNVLKNFNFGEIRTLYDWIKIK